MEERQIQVLIDDQDVAPEIAAALRRIDAGVRLRSIDTELRAPSAHRPLARLVIPSRKNNRSPDEFVALLERFEHDACATLVLDGASPDDSSVSLGRRDWSVDFANEISSAELAGRLTAMCRMHGPMQRMQAEIQELRLRDKQHTDSVRYLGGQLQEAADMQRGLLPDPLPDMPGVQLHTLYQPLDTVSGDMYDVEALGDNRFLLALADATGHGVPAALLTLFVKRMMRTAATDASRGPLDPADVLGRLDHDLRETQLSHCQFVSALCVEYDASQQAMRWARGGAPYPILIRRGLPPQQIHSDGAVLGVLEIVTFEPVELALQPGDVMLFRTDGVDALLVERTSSRRYQDIGDTPWFASLSKRPIADAMADLGNMIAETPRDAWPADDVTVMALEVNAE